MKEVSSVISNLALMLLGRIWVRRLYFWERHKIFRTLTNSLSLGK